MKVQTSVEYLIMVGIGVVLALLAAAGVFLASNTVTEELNYLKSLKESIIGGLR